ncbi:MAG: DUF3102 domain-containing protein [Planctomycetes bacterium]|nr:DUF3102 domain-containing protein [Planctomycetota bacterium]
MTSRQHTDLKDGELIPRDAYPDIAAPINEAHRLWEVKGKEAFNHAIEAGNLLLAAKAKIGHGGFGDFLRRHFDGSETTAQTYMRLARDQKVLGDAKTRRVGDLSIRAAMRSIASATRQVTRVPEELRAKVIGTVLADKSRTVALAQARVERDLRRDAYLVRLASQPALPPQAFVKVDYDAAIAASPELSGRLEMITAMEAERDRLDAEYNALAERLTALQSRIDHDMAILRRDVARLVQPADAVGGAA